MKPHKVFDVFAAVMSAGMRRQRFLAGKSGAELPLILSRSPVRLFAGMFLPASAVYAEAGGMTGNSVSEILVYDYDLHFIHAHRAAAGDKDLFTDALRAAAVVALQFPRRAGSLQAEAPGV